MKQENTREDDACRDRPAKDKTQGEQLVLDGITITHPDRVISETGHVTKGELAEYYAARRAPYAAAASDATRSACCAAPRASTASVSFSAIPAGSRRGHQALRVQAQGQEIRIPLHRG